MFRKLRDWRRTRKCQGCRRRIEDYCALYNVPAEGTLLGRVTKTCAEARAPGAMCGPKAEGFKAGAGWS